MNYCMHHLVAIFIIVVFEQANLVANVSIDSYSMAVASLMDFKPFVSFKVNIHSEILIINIACNYDLVFRVLNVIMFGIDDLVSKVLLSEIFLKSRIIVFHFRRVLEDGVFDFIVIYII